MRILVTGGAGFIGFHLVQALASAGHEVRVLDALLPAVHPDGAPPFPDDPGFDFVHADVRDRQAVDVALGGVDAVCHLAAMVGLGADFDDAPMYAGCNGLGTAVLLAAMARAGVSRLVLASSMVVYGEGAYSCAEHGMAATPPPRRPADLEAGRFEPRCDRCGEPLSAELVGEDTPVGPRSVYADTKVAQEHLAGSWARATGGHAVALRYHNVYGPGMPRDTPYAGVASFFRSALEAGRAPRVFEDGAQRRDFIHVRDVAGATVAGLAAVAAGGPAGPGLLRAYNVGSGAPRTVGDIASALADAYGGPAPVVTGQYRLGDVRHITASSERIARELGWRSSVPFAEGVAEFAAAPAGRMPAGRVPA
jgi:dTDP-L-rhamnose 4-epimerase